MKRCLATVHLGDLNWQDRSFAIESFVRPSFLLGSLERHGVLTPPWLLQTEEGRPVVVDGFKRLKWLQENGTVKVECLLYEADSDRRSLTLQRLEAKMGGPALNLAEKAQIVAKLVGLMSAEQIGTEHFPVLKLALRPHAVERWSRVAAAEDFLLSAVANDRLGERVVLELIDWPETERRKMIALFCELRCSASIQMEIVERISEIALGQGKNRSEIQASPEVQDILKDPDRNHRLKTQALRDLLQRWRFPRWWTRQEHFERNLSASGLPAQIGIVPPPAFEGNSWQMQIRFSSREELSQLLNYARSLASSPEIDLLLNPPDFGPSAKVTERHEKP
jgi:ParB family transcriptional regulator, chromosome partitioning protein